jgi:hypothetical protein
MDFSINKAPTIISNQKNSLEDIEKLFLQKMEDSLKEINLHDDELNDNTNDINMGYISSSNISVVYSDDIL